MAETLAEFILGQSRMDQPGSLPAYTAYLAHLKPDRAVPKQRQSFGSLPAYTAYLAPP